jgi:hypothetical protein
MFLRSSAPVTETAGQRAERWWAVPLTATGVVFFVDVICLVTAGRQNSHGAGPQQGMAAVGVFFLALMSVFALFGVWAAAAFPSGTAARQGQVPFAVYVFLFFTVLFQFGTVWVALSLATNSIGGK